MHIPSGHVQRGVATCEPSVRGKFCTKHPDGARRRHPRRLVRRRRGLVAQDHTAGCFPVVLHRRPKLRRRTSRPPMLSPARRSDAGGPNLQPLQYCTAGRGRRSTCAAPMCRSVARMGASRPPPRLARRRLSSELRNFHWLAHRPPDSPCEPYESERITFVTGGERETKDREDTSAPATTHGRYFR